MQTQQLRAILLLGDLLTMMVVVWIGRLSHAYNIFDVVAWLTASGPFLIGWLLVMPWLGIYQPTIALHWRAWLPRLILGWGLIGLPISMMIRNFLLGRPIIMGVIPTFFIVMFITTNLALMGWRFACQWWMNRQKLINADTAS